MTQSTTGRETQVLIATIFCLNLGSGYTTVMGAKEIFPAGAGVLVGIASQMLLFLLLTNIFLKVAPLRKWIAISVLAVFSVYTSYFSYYQALATGDNIHKGYDRAVEAHQTVLSTFYTPLKVRLETAINEKDNFDTQRKREVSGEGATLQRGPGEEARRYAEKSVEAQAEIAKLKVIETIKGLFEYETRGLTAEEILDKDRKALAAIPPELLPKIHQNGSFIKRENYVEEFTNIPFVLPYQKIKQGDKTAQFSLFLATTVDGIMLLLSSAIEAKKGKPFKKLASLIVSIVTDAKRSKAMILESWYTLVPSYDVTSLDTGDLERGVEYIEVRLQGKGSEFLEFFYNSIDRVTREVDVSSLDNHGNTTFRTGFSILIDQLCSPTRCWCELDNGTFSMNEDHFSAFNGWIIDQILIQARSESRLRSQTSFGQSVRSVRMAIPSFA